jgi:hypothetical protein
MIRGVTSEANANVRGDLVFHGGNNWIMHTPDDNRRTLYIAPSTGYGNQHWNWNSQFRFEPDGSLHVNRICVGGQCMDAGDIARARDAGHNALRYGSEFKLQTTHNGWHHGGWIHTHGNGHMAIADHRYRTTYVPHRN